MLTTKLPVALIVLVSAIAVCRGDDPPRLPGGCRAKEGTAAEPYSKTGWAKEIVHESSGIELVFVPAGKYLMGSPKNERARTDDEIQHEVTLTRPFYLGKYEVTQAQWRKLMGTNPAFFKEDERRPVDSVSWNDCQEFLKKAGSGLRLPTEAQWEYGSRAGSTARFCFGDDEHDLPQYAWYNGGGTHPVGQKKPNAWGLYDMHGNVYEWCQDFFGDYSAEKVTDPTGPAKGERHALRGGCYRYSPRKCRSAYRGGGPPDGRYNNLGFRLSLDLP